MNRAYRRIKSKIKPHEFAVLAATVAIAVLSGYWANVWYGQAALGDPRASEANYMRDLGFMGADGAAAAAQPRQLGAAQGPSPRAAGYIPLASGAQPAMQRQTYDENNQKTIIDLGADSAAQEKREEAAEAAEAQAGEVYGDLLNLRNTGTEKAADAVYTVKIIADGERRELTTYEKTVAQLFAEQGIALSGLDRLAGAYLDGTINSDLHIEVLRVRQETTVEEKFIPAKTVYRDNATMLRGTTKVARAGADGKKRLEYLVTYENGAETDRELLDETVLSEPVSKIIEQGTSGVHAEKSGASFKYTKVIDVKCTAYTSSYEDTGKRPGDPGFGITASGQVAKKGIVAVDPSVIPLGSELYIDFVDESVPDYGYAIAGDTGGKIKGKKVDLYFDADRATLLEFGVKKARVYILG
ncbi:MAG: G5 domain-containing protein [Clostridiales bacterium]|nr:G5 domain-containing protein [Clostridiales bacterium]